MSQQALADKPLLSRGMIAVLCAQFFSAFGDNALLFATLALIKQQLYPDWSQPILQMAFVATYIVLAPFVGQFADSFAKGRVMMVANGLKLAGALVICLVLIRFWGIAWWAWGLRLIHPLNMAFWVKSPLANSWLKPTV